MKQLCLFTDEDFEASPDEERKRYLLNSYKTCVRYRPKIFSGKAILSVYNHMEWLLSELNKLGFYNLSMKVPRCKNCKYYVHTETLGSPDKPIWHCRDGFKPHNDGNGCCVNMCTRNDLMAIALKD